MWYDICLNPWKQKFLEFLNNFSFIVGFLCSHLKWFAHKSKVEYLVLTNNVYILLYILVFLSIYIIWKRVWYVWKTYVFGGTFNMYKLMLKCTVNILLKYPCNIWICIRTYVLCVKSLKSVTGFSTSEAHKISSLMSEVTIISWPIRCYPAISITWPEHFN